MIVPSIDIMGGEAVQLRGGREKLLSAGDPLVLAEGFSPLGEVAVIDLDAALSRGSNSEKIKGLLRIARTRVGGGIRDLATARSWLDAGASRIIIGTAATPDFLVNLPKKRLIAALDCENGDVVVEGWRKKTGRNVVERVLELKELVSGFLVTFVEREGKMMGTDLDAAREIIKAAAPARVTVAGGITTPEDIRTLDELGADAQVGMALYSGALSLGEALSAPMNSDRKDGLWPTVVCNERGNALGLAWSNAESLEQALSTRRGVYFSRKRGLWKKGESSGNTQELLRVDLDCDRDSIRFIVRQKGSGFCHTGTPSCWGNAWGLDALDRTISKRFSKAPEGSYTKRLFDDEQLLKGKLLEEAQELVEAATKDEATWEAADLVYFALVKARKSGATLFDIECELDRRSLVLTRRPGNAK